MIPILTIEIPAVSAALTTEIETPMRKLARSQLSSFRARLHKEQNGICPLCGKFIDLNIAREGAIDHDHKTGEIRGLLHRGCNGAEGKVANAAGRWGAGSMDYAVVIPWLERLVAYLKRQGTGFIYPLHKSADDKRLHRNAKARQVRALKQAQRRVRANAT